MSREKKIPLGLRTYNKFNFHKRIFHFSVSIANTDGTNDGYRYRVTITADGGASATSSAATLTVS